jgi:hypothetical protein
MRFSPTTGKGIMGIGTIAISIDGVVPPAMASLTGGSWAWLTDDICGGQGQGVVPGGFRLYQYVVSTDTLSILDAVYNGGSDVSQAFVAGNSNWARQLGGVFTSPSLGLTLPLAGLMDMDAQGRLLVVTNAGADSGLTTYTAVGALLSKVSTHTFSAARSKDGTVSNREIGTGAWHLRETTSLGTLVPFAPRPIADGVVGMVPVTISGTVYVVELTGAALTIRPATSSMGYVLATSPNIFWPDAVSLSAGTVRVGWSVTTGETPTDMRVADLNLTTGGTTLGSTATGSLVFGSESAVTTAQFTVGPVEGGDFFTSINLPQHQQVLTQTGLIDPIWLAALQEGANAGVGMIDVNRLQGVVPPALGGTGVTTGLTVLDGQNLIDNSTPLSALVTETESTLLGRGEGLGDGDTEEITLGSGLLMTGTILSATATSSGYYSPLTDGDLTEPELIFSLGDTIMVFHP